MKTSIIYFALLSTLILLASSYKHPEMDGESNELLDRATAASFLKHLLEAAAKVQDCGRGSLRSRYPWQTFMPKPFVPALTPPWYTLRNKYNYTFGLDPAVTVLELDVSREPYILTLVTNNKTKGMALRAMIPTQFPFGNVLVNTTVNNSNGDSWEPAKIEDVKDLVAVIEAAFGGNPLYIDVKVREGPFHRTEVGIIITKSVVQFFNDDLSEWYNNFNGVTAEVIGELIKRTYKGLDDVIVLMGTAETSSKIKILEFLAQMWPWSA